VRQAPTSSSACLSQPHISPGPAADSEKSKYLARDAGPTCTTTTTKVMQACEANPDPKSALGLGRGHVTLHSVALMARLVAPNGVKWASEYWVTGLSVMDTDTDARTVGASSRVECQR
jgi:hypothetical protein